MQMRAWLAVEIGRFCLLVGLADQARLLGLCHSDHPWIVVEHVILQRGILADQALPCIANGSAFIRVVV